MSIKSSSLHIPLLGLTQQFAVLTITWQTWFCCIEFCVDMVFTDEIPIAREYKMWLNTLNRSNRSVCPDICLPHHSEYKKNGNSNFYARSSLSVVMNHGAVTEVRIDMEGLSDETHKDQSTSLPTPCNIFYSHNTSLFNLSWLLLDLKLKGQTQIGSQLLIIWIKLYFPDSQAQSHNLTVEWIGRECRL